MTALGSPRVVLAVAGRDLRRRARDPMGLLVMLAIPVALFIVFRLAFGGGDAPQLPRARLAVVDRDSTFVSRFVAGAFGQGKLAEMVEVVPADSVEAERLLRRDKVSAALYLPAGTAAAILKGDSLTLRLRKNPGQRILPGILEEIVATMTDGGSAARDLLRAPLRRIDDATRGWSEGPGSEAVASVSVEIQRVMEKSGAYFLPPAIQIRTEEAEGEKKDDVSFLMLFFPSLVGLAVLFLSQSLALDLVVDRTEGTVRRALALGCRSGDLLLGKAVAGIVVLAAALVVMLGLGRAFLGLPVSALLESWILAVSAGLAVLCALQWVALLPRDPKAAGVITNLVILPLAFLGGCFFPMEGLGEGLYNLARRLPVGWMVERFKNALLDRPRDPSSAVAVLVFLLAAALFFALASRRAERRFREG